MTLALAGWLAAAGALLWALRTRRRRECVARAEHEIRGALCALRLALDAGRDVPAPAVAVQFDRVAAGLAELHRPGRFLPPASAVSLEQVARDSVEAWRPVARLLGRDVELDWNAGPAAVEARRARLAQVTGNLIANALEHGRGCVRVVGERDRGRLTISVCDDGVVKAPTGRRRGRGLSIAARAARESGGELSLVSRAEGTAAVLTLPAGEA